MILIFGIVFLINFICANDFGYNYLTDDFTSSGNNITNNYYVSNLTGNLTNISEMGDVDYTGVDDDDVLKWDDAIKQWVDSSLNSILSFGDDWFSFTDTNEISFNEVKLNGTIDMRTSGLGDNSSWNQIFADTLYSPIGSVGNSSFNQTLTDSLYSPIGTGGNASWNETYADEIYLPMNNNRTETNNSKVYWNSGTLVIEGYE